MFFRAFVTSFLLTALLLGCAKDEAKPNLTPEEAKRQLKELDQELRKERSGK